MTLIAKLGFEKYNIKKPNSRNKFHLSDKEKLRNLFTNAGFKEILIWEQFTPFEFLGDE